MSTPQYQLRNEGSGTVIMAITFSIGGTTAQSVLRKPMTIHGCGMMRTTKKLSANRSCTTAPAGVSIAPRVIIALRRARNTTDDSDATNQLMKKINELFTTDTGLRDKDHTTRSRKILSHTTQKFQHAGRSNFTEFVE